MVLIETFGYIKHSLTFEIPKLPLIARKKKKSEVLLSFLSQNLKENG